MTIQPDIDKVEQLKKEILQNGLKENDKEYAIVYWEENDEGVGV